MSKIRFSQVRNGTSAFNAPSLIDPKYKPQQQIATPQNKGTFLGNTGKMIYAGGESFMGGIEDTVDFGRNILSYASELLSYLNDEENPEKANKYREFSTQMRKNAERNDTETFMTDLQTILGIENPTDYTQFYENVAGDKFKKGGIYDAAARGVGNELAKYGLLAATGIPNTSPMRYLPTAAQSFSKGVQKSRDAGRSSGDQIRSGIANTALSVGVESLSGGLTERMGGGMLDKYKRQLTDRITSPLLRNLTNYGGSVFSEVGEEELEGIIEPYLDRAFADKNAKNFFTDEETGELTLSKAVETAIVTAITTAILGAPNTVQNIKYDSEQIKTLKQLEKMNTTKLSSNEKKLKMDLTQKLKDNLKERKYNVDNLLKKKASNLQSADTKVGVSQPGLQIEQPNNKPKTKTEELNIKLTEADTKIDKLKADFKEYTELLKVAKKEQNNEDIGIYTHELMKVKSALDKAVATKTTTEEDLTKTTENIMKQEKETKDVETFKKTEAYNVIENIAEKQGVKLNIISKDISGDVQHGKFTPITNEITLNLKSTKSMLNVFVHELTHPLENTKNYNSIKKYIFENFDKKRIAQITKDLQREYKKANLELTEETLNSEVVAHIIEDNLLTSEKDIKELLNKDKSVFKIMHDFVNDLVIKFKGTSQQRMTLDLQKLYKKALREHSQTQNTQSAKELNDRKDIDFDRQTASQLPEQAIDTRKKLPKKEVAKKEITPKKEVVKKEVIKKEVVKKEVVKKEAIKKEVLPKKEIKKELKKEIVKKEVLPKQEVKKETFKKITQEEKIKKETEYKIPKVVFRGEVGNKSLHPGVTYFIDNKHTAEGYGDLKAASIKMKNPLVINAHGEAYFEIPVGYDHNPHLLKYLTNEELKAGQISSNSFASDWEDFKEEGYDGIIVKNVIDNYLTARKLQRLPDTFKGKDTVYITFSDDQITSKNLLNVKNRSMKATPGEFKDGVTDSLEIFKEKLPKKEFKKLSNEDIKSKLLTPKTENVLSKKEQSRLENAEMLKNREVTKIGKDNKPLPVKVTKATFNETIKNTSKIIEKATPENLAKEKFLNDFNKAMNNTNKEIKKVVEQDVIDEKELEKLLKKDNGLYSIGGINAALDVDEQNNLNLAKKLQKEGIDPKKIWAMTGFEFNPKDLDWRFHIPDGKLINQKININKEYELSQLYDAPELFKYYPQLKDIKIKFNFQQINKSTANGGYNPVENKIYINKARLNFSPLFRYTLIHELQHAIQEIEGFGSGGGLGDASTILTSNIDSLDANTNFRKLTIDLYKSFSGEVEARNAAYRAMLDSDLLGPGAKSYMISETQDKTYSEQILLPKKSYETSFKNNPKPDVILSDLVKINKDQYSVGNIDAKATTQLEELSEKVGAKELKEAAIALADKAKREKSAKQSEASKKREPIRSTFVKESGITNINLNNAKDISQAKLSLMPAVRIFNSIFGDANGNTLYSTLIKPTIEGAYNYILFANQERNEIKKLGIKPRSPEAKAVQQLGEGGYYTFDKSISNKDRTAENGVWHDYTLKDVKENFPDSWKKIKIAEMVIREKYDKYHSMINEINRKFGLPEVEYRENYFLHFKANNSLLGSPSRTTSTDLAGLDTDFSLSSPFFASKLQRRGIYTDYDAITGIDRYLDSIEGVLFQTENIERLRAVENYIRNQYDIKILNTEVENLILKGDKSQIGKRHLSSFIVWLNNYTNALAGQQNKLDASFTQLFGDKTLRAINAVRSQIAKNLVLWNTSPPLTNFISSTQGIAFTPKKYVALATAKTLRNIFIRDNLMDQSVIYTTRKGADANLSSNWYEKASEIGGMFMKATDLFNTELIVRMKYEQYTNQGYKHEIALQKADKFASKILGGRTKGELPQIYSSKLLGIFTQFSLEPLNQISTIYSDTFKTDFAAENKKVFDSAIKKAAYNKSQGLYTFLQLLAYGFGFNELYEKIVGRRPAHDLVGIFKNAFKMYNSKTLPPEEATFRVIEQILEQVPFVDMFVGGGRTPTADNLPDFSKIRSGRSSLKDETLYKLPYLILPGGGSQLAKTLRGAKLYENKKTPGKYLPSKKADKEKYGTDRLKYPTKKDPLSVAQNLLFGANASKEAKEYYEEGWIQLSPRQTMYFEESGLEIKEFRTYMRKLNSFKADKNPITKQSIRGSAKIKQYRYIDNLKVDKEIKQILYDYVDEVDSKYLND